MSLGDHYEQLTNVHDSNLLYTLLNPQKRLEKGVDTIMSHTEDAGSAADHSNAHTKYSSELVNMLVSLMPEQKEHTFAKVEMQYQTDVGSGVLISESRSEIGQTELQWLNHFKITEGIRVGLMHNLPANQIKDRGNLSLVALTFDEHSELGQKICGITETPKLSFGVTNMRK